MQKICPGNVLRHLENETKVGEKGKLKTLRGEGLCNPTQVYIFLDGFSQPNFFNITLHSFVFSWNCSMTKMLQTWTWQLWELKVWLLKRPPHHLTLILGFTFFLIRGMLWYAVIFCHAPLWIAPRPLTEPLAASYKLLALQDVRFFVAGNNLVEPGRDLPKDLALIVLNPLQSSRRLSLTLVTEYLVLSRRRKNARAEVLILKAFCWLLMRNWWNIFQRISSVTAYVYTF